MKGDAFTFTAAFHRILKTAGMLIIAVSAPAVILLAAGCATQGSNSSAPPSPPATGVNSANAGYPMAVKFSPDGRYLIAGEGSKGSSAVVVWDMATGLPKHNLRDVKRTVMSVDVDRGQRYIAAGSQGGIKVWDFATGKLLFDYDKHKSNVNAVAFSPEGWFLFSGSDDKDSRIKVCSPAGKGLDLTEHWSNKDSHAKSVSVLASDAQGNYLASGGLDGSVRVFWQRQGIPLYILNNAHAKPVLGAFFDPKGELLVTAGQDGTVKIWKLPGCTPMKTIENPGDEIWWLTLSPSSDQFYAGMKSGSVAVFGFPDGKPLRTFKAHAKSVQGLALNPKGTILATAGYDQCLKLWNQKNGALVATLYSFDDATLATLPSGEYAGTGNYGKYLGSDFSGRKSDPTAIAKALAATD